MQVWTNMNYKKIQRQEIWTTLKNATKYAVRQFRTYLTAKKVPVDFENFSKTELDTKLRSFYAELRNTKGELYKHTSLLSIRSGRHLSKLNSFDITKDVEFKSSNYMFTSMLKLYLW